MKTPFIKNESGSTAVEFSLIAIAFFTVVFGIMEAGRIFWTQNAIQYAVENASRAVLVDSTLSEGEIEDVAADSLDEMFIASAPFSVTAEIVDEGDYSFIEINGTYQYTAMITALLPASLASFQLDAATRRPLVWNE